MNLFDDGLIEKIKEYNTDDEIYLVGGYLRNYFINKTISSDRDIVCIRDSYLFAKKLTYKLNGTFIELDNENKIYRVVLEDKTNYIDISQALNNNIEQDAFRRDFTINSIYYDIKNDKILDYTNGIEDIKNKIIRTTNLSNILDDPLRLLRLYRFYSITSFDIEEELCEFVKNNIEKINSVAKERINYEIMQIFSSKYLTDTLLKMLEDNVLEYIFPFVKEVKKIPPNSHHHLDLIHHLIETVNNIRLDKPLLKLAAFYHDIGKPSTWTIEESGRHRFIGHDTVGGELVKEELKKLGFSNKQINYISKLVRYHIYPCSLINAGEDNKKAKARFIRKLGDEVPDVIELARADRLSAQGEAITKDMVDLTLNHLENLLEYYAEIKNTFVMTPLLNGEDIMNILNIKPSKKVGEILENLKEMQIAKEITTKKEALEYIKTLQI